jgi:hypothetical protein
MDKLLFFVCALALAATPAHAAGDEAKARAGVNASTEGGASLGGTGIDTQAKRPGLRSADEDEKERAAQERGKLRVPIGRGDRDPAKPPTAGAAGSASTGASAPERRGGTDLGYEAEKEEEEFQKKKRTAPLRRAPLKK